MSPRYGRPEVDRVRWWRRIWHPFWVLPALVAAASALLGTFLPSFDEHLAPWVPSLFASGADGASNLLGTIAGAMISVTGLVFSITMVVLQLASSQFTPRLLGQFLESRTVQLTLGVFTGSFIFALSVLRSVRAATDAEPEFVPQVSVTIAYLYVLTAVALLVVFIQHVTRSVQVSRVIADLGRRTRAGAIRFFEGEQPAATWSPRPDTPRTEIAHPHGKGMVTSIDSTGLARWAAHHDCVVQLRLGLGDFIAHGQPLGTVWGVEDADADAVARHITVSPERELAGDFGFGVQQLTDIADRALSPGINDPTTAIQVVDELYAVLRRAVAHPDPSPYIVDEHGDVRAAYRAPTIAHLVDRSLVEIGHYAEDAPRVLQRLHEVLDELIDAAIPAHRPTLERARQRIGSPPEARHGR